MQRIIFLLFFIFSNAAIFAQEKADTSLLAVEYFFSFNTDSMNKSKVVTENMVLYVGKERSWFVASNIVERNRLIREGAKQGRPTGFSLQDPAIARLNSNAPQIFKFRTEGYFNEVRTFFKTFTWKDQLPAFNWETDTATTNIKGYNCLKATASYKGRTYTAWYTPEIPIADGPWKFHGLPGLILKITDAKNEVKFEMRSIQKSAAREPVVIQLEKNMVVTTKKEYEDMVTAAYENPAGVISGVTGRTYKTSAPIQPRKRPKPGNAIELTD